MRTLVHSPPLLSLSFSLHLSVYLLLFLEFFLYTSFKLQLQFQTQDRFRVINQASHTKGAEVETKKMEKLVQLSNLAKPSSTFINN